MAKDGGLALLRRARCVAPKGGAVLERIDAILDGTEPQAKVHLGVFAEPYLSAILDGRKTVESRFALNRCAPYQQVSRGDVILLKKSGGPVVGLAVAGEPSFYSLDPSVLEDLRNRFRTELYAEDEGFWTERAGKRYATLIRLEEAVETRHLSVDKRDRRGWVTYQ